MGRGILLTILCLTDCISRTRYQTRSVLIPVLLQNMTVQGLFQCLILIGTLVIIPVSSQLTDRTLATEFQALSSPLEAVDVCGTVSKIIHQSYKTKDLPVDFTLWQATWRKNYPDWEYKFWTDEDNRKLVQDLFPSFLAVYDSLRHPIQKADSARYMYMYAYGGIYVDLDFESLRPLDEDLLSSPVIFAEMLNEDVPYKYPNAFLASRPREGFWLDVLIDIASGGRNPGYPEDSTGPHVLRRVYDAKYKDQPDVVKILPQKYIYPYKWGGHTDEEWRHCSATFRNNPVFNSTRCKELFPEAYAITYWTHGW